MNKDLFISRLKLAMKSTKTSQCELARLSGINKGSISSYVSGKYLPKQDKIYIISKILNINPEWLSGNSEYMNIEEVVPFVQTPNFNSYPMISGSVSAGLPSLIDGEDDFDRIELPDFFLGKYAGNKDIIVMRVNGDSMNRTIPDGAIVVVLTSVKISSISTGDIVIFSDNYDYSMKRFFNDKKNRRYIFSPDSFDSNFSDIVFDYDNCDGIELIGKVIMYNVSL